MIEVIYVNAVGYYWGGCVHGAENESQFILERADWTH